MGETQKPISITLTIKTNSQHKIIEDFSQASKCVQLSFLSNPIPYNLKKTTLNEGIGKAYICKTKLPLEKEEAKLL